MNLDEPALIELPRHVQPVVSERHVQAVAIALHEQWGPCDVDNADDCNGRTCHVTLIRAVLERSMAFGLMASLQTLQRATEEAWRVACYYGELTDHLTPHMALSKAHMGTVVARIAPILGAAVCPLEADR